MKTGKLGIREFGVRCPVAELGLKLTLACLVILYLPNSQFATPALHALRSACAVQCGASVRNFAQKPDPIDVELSAPEAPPGGWTVGDPIPLRLSVTHPDQIQLTLPELPRQWGPFEVLGQSLLASTRDDQGRVRTTAEIVVTLWAPGDYQAPPLTIRYRDPTDQLYEAQVPPLTLSVASVLAEGDTGLRDLKPQISLPGPAVWPWVLGGLALALLAGIIGRWGLHRWRQRRQLELPAGPPADPRPPHVIAYAELDRIAQLDLPRQGAFKRHYSLVADCLRGYVERRYQVPALDRTTGELTAALRGAGLKPGHLSLLREILDESDLVKFAKHQPPIDQAHGVVEKTHQAVQATSQETPTGSEPPDSETVSSA